MNDKVSLQLAANKNQNNYLTERAADYIRQSVSENSRLAFKADMHCFAKFGGVIPASPEIVAEYITSCAGVLSIATIQRRLASISKAHRMKDFSSPVQSEVVRMTMRGIQRTHGVPQDCASPLLKEDVVAICGHLQDENNKNIRDRALILIGFCGAFRRSELVRLNIEDVEFKTEGAVITLTRSKTDQTGQGRKIGINYGRGLVCPVKSLKAWIDILDTDTGPIFRPVSKGGAISDQRLSAGAVSKLIKSCVKKIELDPAKYSGHSLRSGFCTSAYMCGADSITIRKTTNHKSDAMLEKYIRDGDLFNNASGILF